MRAFTNRPLAMRRRAGGAILVVSLLLLLVLTILAVATMRASTSEERMAGNARDMNLAFQSAEAGARGAETWLLSLTERPSACGDIASCDRTKDVLALGVLPDIRPQAPAWWQANGVEFGTAGTQEVQRTTEDPRYVLEELAEVRDNVMVGEAPPEGRIVYRVYGRASGGTNTAQSVVETTISRRF